MSFTNYLEDENDKPYFTTNSLAHYYDKMEGFAKAVEGSAKALNLTKEEVEKRITLYIEQNKNELDQRLAQWDGKLETFDSSVETLLTEWVDNGTLIPLIDSTLIDQKIAPVTQQLEGKANEVETFEQLVPKRYVFGGQLERMKYALSNPLEQYMSIVGLGDSKMWGQGATGNPADYQTGRDGTLSDIRDNYNSLSWFNLFRRYIGKNYAGNVAPVLTNWPASPSGQSIAEFSKQYILFPDKGDFTYTTTGNVFAKTITAQSSSLSGQQLSITIESGADGVGIINFPFTGKEFTLSYDSVNTASMKYELFLNGVSQGIFSTAPGEDGSVVGYHNQRIHKFPYVKNATIEIKTVKNQHVGYQSLRIGGIIINKKIKISNQGIMGIRAQNYASNNLAGNSKGDGVALSAEDNYIITSFGSNDRIISSAYAKGVNTFKGNLETLIDLITSSDREIILMNDSPVANENPASYSFTMQDVKNVSYQLGKEKTIDVVDNYSIFGNMPVADYTTDLLHYNDYGNVIVARNLINSMEFN